MGVSPSRVSKAPNVKALEIQKVKAMVKTWVRVIASVLDTEG